MKNIYGARMTEKQRNILIIGAALTALLLVFPPLQFCGPYGCRWLGFGFIFSVSRGTVNVGLLFVQLVGVWVICAAMWFLFKSE